LSARPSSAASEAGIHDGFGLMRFKEKTSDPNTPERSGERVLRTNTTFKTLSFVTKLKRVKFLSSFRSSIAKD
jgi:hypothetical protein